MNGNESNVSVLFLIVLIVGFGVVALNVGRGSSIDYGDGRERVSKNRLYDASDTRTFLAFNALASAYNHRRAPAELD